MSGRDSEKLRELTERLQAVVSSAPIILTALDEAGIFTFAEGRGLEALQLEPRDVIGRSGFDLGGAVRVVDDAGALQGTGAQMLERALAGVTVSGLVGFRGVDLQFTCSPLRDPSGRVSGVIAVSMDVSERKLAQLTIQKERDFSSAVVDIAGALVIVLDVQGRIIRFNRACEEATGYPFSQVRHRRFWEVLVLPEDAATIRSAFERLLAGEFPGRSEYHWLARDGSRRLILWSHAPLKSRVGMVEYVVGTGIDITDRRRAEEERMRALEREQAARTTAEEAQLRIAFLSKATSAILSEPLDSPGRLEIATRLAVPYLADWSMLDVLQSSGALERVAVTHSDPAKAALASQLKAHPPPMAAAEGVAKVLRTSRSVIYEDLTDEVLYPDARHATAVGTASEEAVQIIRELGLRSYMAVPLIARGRALGVLTLVSVRDPRRYGPVELALGEDLARRAAVALDNARLYQEARDAVRAREEFLSIASHELRTPLTSLQLALESLLRISRRGPLAAAPQPFVQSVLAAAERQSRRLARLVDDLLDVSRLNVGRLELVLDEVDLTAVVREVVAELKEELELAGCQVTLRESGPVRGHWDRLRLEQVVLNLLSNAMKYGAGEPIDIDITLEPGTGRARLTVRDHGIGIAPEALAQIFDRFERAVSSRHYGGLGLGLYIVRLILEALGGTVRVESMLGAGALFTVELPVAGPAV